MFSTGCDAELKGSVVIEDSPREIMAQVEELFHAPSALRSFRFEPPADRSRGTAQRGTAAKDDGGAPKRLLPTKVQL